MTHPGPSTVKPHKVLSYLLTIVELRQDNEVQDIKKVKAERDCAGRRARAQRPRMASPLFQFSARPLVSSVHLEAQGMETSLPELQTTLERQSRLLWQQAQESRQQRKSPLLLSQA